jgi:hypothetical protein
MKNEMGSIIWPATPAKCEGPGCSKQPVGTLEWEGPLKGDASLCQSHVNMIRTNPTCWPSRFTAVFDFANIDTPVITGR